jgi:hypothetical protein
MGATKESPATQLLEWAVGKLDEASKTDWVEKLSAMTASKPAYLRGVLPSSALSRPAPAPPAPAGGSQAEFDAALARAAQAEARADRLGRRVVELEQQLAATNSHPQEVSVADEEASAEEEDHKSHWWSRHH